MMLRCNVQNQCVLLVMSVIMQSLHLLGSLILLQDMALSSQQQLHCAVYKYQTGPVTNTALPAPNDTDDGQQADQGCSH